MIYRFALQEPAPVDITDKGFAKPGLLTASQAIRSETLGIHYLQNTFALRIDNHDPPKSSASAKSKIRSVSARGS